MTCDHKDATLVVGDETHGVYWCAQCQNNVVLTRIPTPQEAAPPPELPT